MQGNSGLKTSKKANHYSLTDGMLAQGRSDSQEKKGYRKARDHRAEMRKQAELSGCWTGMNRVFRMKSVLTESQRKSKEFYVDRWEHH